MMKFAAACFLAVFFCLALHAERFGPVTVEEVPQAFSEGNQYGYFIREFRVGNDGANPAEVHMRLYSRGGMDFSAERKLLVAPGTVRNVTLYWPPVLGMWRRDSVSEAALELVINGRRVRHSLVAYGTHGRWDYRNVGDILASGSVPLSDYRKFWGEPESHRSARNIQEAAIPVSQWGVHQRDYSGVEYIWIASTDRVPPAVERALMDWVYSGGTLTVCVPPNEPWPEGKEPEKASR